VGARRPRATMSRTGLINAIQQIFPQSIRVRCWYHRMGNMVTKLPDDARAEVTAHLRAVREAPTLEAGQQQAARVLEKFSDEYPSAMKGFSDDLEASLSHLRLPVRHRVHVRTTNLLVRRGAPAHQSDPEVAGRKECPQAGLCHPDPLLRAWRRIAVSDLEVQQLRLLLKELAWTRRLRRAGARPMPIIGRHEMDESIYPGEPRSSPWSHLRTWIQVESTHKLLPTQNQPSGRRTFTGDLGLDPFTQSAATWVSPWMTLGGAVLANDQACPSFRELGRDNSESEQKASKKRARAV
jgi:hypothetical protein